MTMPAALRTARIAKLASVRHCSRIETAIAENESRAPVIHSTTGTRRGGVTSAFFGERCAPLFRVRLVFGPRLVEGRKLHARRIDGDDFREPVERNVEAPRVV